MFLRAFSVKHIRRISIIYTRIHICPQCLYSCVNIYNRNQSPTIFRNFFLTRKYKIHMSTSLITNVYRKSDMMRTKLFRTANFKYIPLSDCVWWLLNLYMLKHKICHTVQYWWVMSTGISKNMDFIWCSTFILMLDLVWVCPRHHKRIKIPGYLLEPVGLLTVG